MIELSGMSVKEIDRSESGIGMKVVRFRLGEKLYDEFSVDVNPKETVHLVTLEAYVGFHPINSLHSKLQDSAKVAVADENGRLRHVIKEVVSEFIDMFDQTPLLFLQERMAGKPISGLLRQ